MAVNGNLLDSDLSAIPGGRLRKDAALRWNAMCIASRARGWGTPMPNGPLSSYRPYWGQVMLRKQWCDAGACGNAAVPGTSNHGWGLAVDTNDHWIPDALPQFGFDKRWSDAPWESWHRKWGGFGPVAPAPKPKKGWAPNLRLDDFGPAVMRLQTYLKWNGLVISPDGKFGPGTKLAVKRFQHAHGLEADGVVGIKTWVALRRNKRVQAYEKRMARKGKWWL